MSDLQPIKEIVSRGRGRARPDEVALSDAEELVLDLVRVGIGLRKAEHLVAHYDAALIRRQLAWLPLRGPKRPASLLIAAIEHDYDAPAYAEAR